MTELFAALVGGVLALLGSFLFHWHSSRENRKSLAQAFVGEIRAILVLIEKRKYHESLERWRTSMLEGQSSPGRAFMAMPKQNYFTIFEANASKIGVLPRRASMHVVRFYVLTKSLLEDLTNEELFSRPPELVAKILIENLEVLDDLQMAGQTALYNLDRSVSKPKETRKATHT